MQRNRLVRRRETDGIADRPHIIRSDGSNAIQTINAVVANMHNIRDGYSLPGATVPVQSQVVPGIVFKKPANSPKIIVVTARDSTQSSAVPGHGGRLDHGPTCWGCRRWRVGWSWCSGRC